MFLFIYWICFRRNVLHCQLRGSNRFVDFLPFSHVCNFCDFLFASLSTKPLLKKGVTLIGKALLPLGLDFFS